MCIKIYCKYCKDLIPTTDMRRHICDKPECQVAKYRDEKRLYILRHRTDPNRSRCLICEGEIPAGKYRSKYCKQDCARKGKLVQQKERRKLKRYLMQNKLVTRVSAVSLCSTVEPTVPTPPLRSGGLLYG